MPGSIDEAVAGVYTYIGLTILLTAIMGLSMLAEKPWMRSYWWARTWRSLMKKYWWKNPSPYTSWKKKY